MIEQVRARRVCRHRHRSRNTALLCVVKMRLRMTLP